MATVEQAENIEQQVTMNTGRDSFSATVRIAELSGNGIMRAVAALQETLNERREVGAERAQNRAGQIDMEEFTQNLRGDRDIVSLNREDVADVLGAELTRLGVQYAVQTPEPGVHEFHVHARDAKVLAHALNRAQEAVYLRDDDAVVKTEIAERIADKAHGRDEPEPERTREHEREQRDDARVPEREARDAAPTPEREEPEPTFPVYERTEDGETTVQITKERALAALDRYDPEEVYATRNDPTGPGYDVSRWAGRDKDVDRVLSEKFPQLMPERQRAEAKQARELGSNALREVAPNLDEPETRGKSR